MRRADPFNGRAALLSLGLHAVVFALAWVSALRHPPEIEFLAYEIELVSPPPSTQADEPQPPAEEVVVERPTPEPLPPEPEPDVVAIEEPEPEPEPPAPEPEPTPPEPEPEETPSAAVEPPPEAAPTTSGENINVRIEGLRRDYPAYYENIIRQINRCFVSRWRQGGNWEAEVLFTVGRDGIATDLEFGKRSGNVAFDYAAMEAAGDCAGQGRFGPLPEDFPWEAVRIRFTFEPPSEQE
jgi:outer membrane biosynthesis protein TonB